MSEGIAVPELPEVPAPEESVAERLRASLARSLAGTTQDLRVPGYDELHLVFRALSDWGEFRDAVREAQIDARYAREADQEIKVATTTMLLACVDSYAVVDGVKAPIGEKLGLPLYDYIFPADGTGEYRPQTDGEAVILLFGGDTVALMMFAGQLNIWSKAQEMAAEAALAGNS